ncbi:OmpA family protein [Legionella dresdenensis]|uniref:OmpA family protein n=1 Tax=Legionella dresdenensis TaxID=450200 RepID=A0ABV8CIJ5_9GAMM
MTNKCFLYKTITALIISCSIPATCNAALEVNYISPMGAENWKMTGSRLRCGLSLKIPNFGMAYFEQYAAREPHFILSKWQQVERRIPALVYARSPVWKPEGADYFISKTTVNPGEYGLFLPRDPALKALTYLSQGFVTRFQYRSDQGFIVSVSISPIKFQKPFSRYQECLGNLLPFDLESVKESIFLFATDSYKLTEEARKQLDRIAEYSHADPQIKRISIVGYTDNTGRKSYNNAISEARAKAVQRYLISKGVRESKLSITWYGLKDPAQPNDTEAGKAANRRVVVEIIK